MDQLKKELSKFELPTAGNRAELQKRFIEKFKRHGLDIDTYEFEEKKGLEFSTQATTSTMNLNSMFAMMMKKMKKKT